MMGIHQNCSRCCDSEKKITEHNYFLYIVRRYVCILGNPSRIPLWAFFVKENIISLKTVEKNL